VKQLNSEIFFRYFFSNQAGARAILLRPAQPGEIRLCRDSRTESNKKPPRYAPRRFLFVSL
jgi:hypothetical protein